MPREVSNSLLEDYTAGRAQYRPIADEDQPIDLLDGGIDTSVNPERIPPGRSPSAQNVRLTDGGLSSESTDAIVGTAFGGSDKTIMALKEFQRVSGAKEYLIRMRGTGWDRWDGTSWLTLGGSLSGGQFRPYTAVMKNRILGANGVDRIKSWDGSDGTPVADLSADAPKARFIVPFGSRLIAAYINPGGGFDPYRVQWPADGNITNWTDPLLGAGTGILEPEGQSRGFGDFFTGLSALATAVVLYRQSAIVVGVRTGVGARPFQFYTPVHGLGTLSPHSIVSVGRQSRNIFLGDDLNVYTFDGTGSPIPIGDPIHRTIRKAITNPEDVQGQVDPLLGDYWLGIPTGSDGLIQEAYVLSLRELLLANKIIWHRRILPTGVKCLGFGFRASSVLDPIVDTLNSVPADIVDNVNRIVDNYGGSAPSSPRFVLTGNNLGEVKAFDYAAFVANGFWFSKPFGSISGDTTVDLVYGRTQVRTAGQLKIGVSFDGGGTVVAERTVNYSVGDTTFSTWHQVTGRAWQVKLTVVSGDLTISDLKAVVKPRGRLTSAA